MDRRVRIRSIKPAFWKSLSIAELPVATRLHFIGLWNYADDEGRGHDDPRLLKAELWPLDDKMTAAKVRRMQDELAEAGRIMRYQVGGRPYFQVTNWSEHQRVNKPQASEIPTPLVTDDSVTVPGIVTERSRLEGKGLGKEEEKEGKGLGIAPLPARDELFESVAENCGVDWHHLTPTARGALNKAVSEIRTAGGTPSDVMIRAENWPYDVPLTPSALAKHWPRLHSPPPVHRKPEPDRVANVERNLHAMEKRGIAQ